MPRTISDQAAIVTPLVPQQGPTTGLSCARATARLSRVSKNSGFTLFEIMVVIVIIGIILTFGMLSVGQSQDRVLEDEARRLKALMTLAKQEAVIEAQEYAVELYKNGYQFLQLQQAEDAWQWQPLAGKEVFRPRCVAGNIEMDLILEGESVAMTRKSCEGESSLDDSDDKPDFRNLSDDETQTPPRIFLLSSGEMTPFLLTMTMEEGGEYKLEGDLIGTLEVTNEDDG